MRQWVRVLNQSTLRVTRTAPRLAHVVRDAPRVPNQRLHRTVAAQPPVAPRLPVSRGAVMPRRQQSSDQGT